HGLCHAGGSGPRKIASFPQPRLSRNQLHWPPGRGRLSGPALVWQPASFFSAMIVQTEFPCGNGRVYWINPGHFEVEAIAYSKAPRYICFRIEAVETPGEQPVILRPDRYFHDDFRYFKGAIWVRRGEG